MPDSFLVQEEDGVSRFTLEEGGGSLLLEAIPNFIGVVAGAARAIASAVGGSVASGNVMGRSRAGTVIGGSGGAAVTGGSRAPANVERS